MNNKKVGLLGLSADPPHLGHLEIARLLLGGRVVDEIWLIPCFEHPCRKSLISPEHRWEMTKLLEEPGIKACDIEIFRGGKSYTIDTVKILKAKYPSYQFFWVVGSDIVKTESYLRWKDWDILSLLVGFLVVLRPGFEIEKAPPRFTLIKGKRRDISSSDIRRRIRNNLSIASLVPPEVKSYIRKHKLYK